MNPLIKRASLTSCLLLAMSASANSQSVGTPQVSGGNTENGKKLFTSYGCYECHGTVGQGGTGPRIAPATISVSALLRYVRQPAGQMPPYTVRVATDQELTDIYEYLKSVPPPASVASIRLLKQ